MINLDEALTVLAVWNWEYFKEYAIDGWEGAGAQFSLQIQRKTFFEFEDIQKYLFQPISTKQIILP